MCSSGKLDGGRLRSFGECHSRRHTTIDSLARLWNRKFTCFRTRLLENVTPSSNASDGVTLDAFESLLLAESQRAHLPKHRVRQLLRHSTGDRDAICSPHCLTRRTAHNLKRRSDALRRPVHAVPIIASVRGNVGELHRRIVVLRVLGFGQAAAGHRGAGHLVPWEQLLAVALRAEALVPLVSGLAHSVVAALVGLRALRQRPAMELSVVQLLELEPLLAITLELPYGVFGDSMAAASVPDTIVDVQAFRGRRILAVGEALDLELLGTLRRHHLVGSAGEGRRRVVKLHCISFSASVSDRLAKDCGILIGLGILDLGRLAASHRGAVLNARKLAVIGRTHHE
mmetsp:Transcript_20560/g.52241  ORF Transcript_20560/g.52241 Transcript_20560/m.52241 type:complete len:342 (-) Transcript_20560:3014-4039(-)